MDRTLCNARVQNNIVIYGRYPKSFNSNLVCTCITIEEHLTCLTLQLIECRTKTTQRKSSLNKTATSSKIIKIDVEVTAFSM